MKKGGESRQREVKMGQCQLQGRCQQAVIRRSKGVVCRFLCVSQSHESLLTYKSRERSTTRSTGVPSRQCGCIHYAAVTAARQYLLMYFEWGAFRVAIAELGLGGPSSSAMQASDLPDYLLSAAPVGT